MESNGLVHREVFAVVPPKTEYSLTEKGRLAMPIVETLRNFGVELMAIEGIDISSYNVS